MARGLRPAVRHGRDLKGVARSAVSLVFVTAMIAVMFMVMVWSNSPVLQQDVSLEFAAFALLILGVAPTVVLTRAARGLYQGIRGDVALWTETTAHGVWFSPIESRAHAILVRPNSQVAVPVAEPASAYSAGSGAMRTASLLTGDESTTFGVAGRSAADIVAQVQAALTDSGSVVSGGPFPGTATPASAFASPLVPRSVRVDASKRRVVLVRRRSLGTAFLAEVLPALFLISAISTPLDTLARNQTLTIGGREYSYTGEPVGWDQQTITFLVFAILLQLALVPLIGRLLGVVPGLVGYARHGELAIVRPRAWWWFAKRLPVEAGGPVELSEIASVVRRRGSSTSSQVSTAVTLSCAGATITAVLHAGYDVVEFARLKAWCEAHGLALEPSEYRGGRARSA